MRVVADTGPIGEVDQLLDFAHFRAATPPAGYWQLIVDEARYADAVVTPEDDASSRTE